MAVASMRTGTSHRGFAAHYDTAGYRDSRPTGLRHAAVPLLAGALLAVLAGLAAPQGRPLAPARVTVVTGVAAVDGAAQSAHGAVVHRVAR
jgi:hypothetical protein